MKFKEAVIRNFRRFTELTVQGIPETARLIMLAGPNGCGKSSFFDALQVWKQGKVHILKWDEGYHRKAASQATPQWSSNDVQVNFYSRVPTNQRELKKLFYIRSAYRNDPEFAVTNFQRIGDPLDKQRINRMIDNDMAVSSNYTKIVAQALEDVFEQDDSSVTLEQFRKQALGDVKKAFDRLFPEMELNSLANPLKDGTFRFTKGVSSGFLFKNLSGGEKAAFDLILDLVVARRDYNNTVFCIDEPESHMNARLQAELLSVLYDLIPQNCQLMLATHSIGMMRRAQDIEMDKPGRVVFLDFGDRDFDQPQVIKPATPNRAFWNKAYEVALDDLAALVAPSRVVICEGSPNTGNPTHRHSLDAQCYERIFETEFPDTRFVSMGGDKEIIGDTRGLAETLRLLIDGLEIVRLVDRDDRTENTSVNLNQQGVQVLSWRNLEAYLFDDEVLRELAVSKGQEDKTEELIAAKQQICNAKSDTKAPNDLKPVRREIYNACKHILQLVECGNNVVEFMVETLAPLIKPGMHVYERLKRDIFGSSGFRVNRSCRRMNPTSASGERG